MSISISMSMSIGRKLINKFPPPEREITRAKMWRGVMVVVTLSIFLVNTRRLAPDISPYIHSDTMRTAHSRTDTHTRAYMCTLAQSGDLTSTPQPSE